MSVRRIFLSFSLVVLLAASEANAARYDLNLGKFVTSTCPIGDWSTGEFQPDCAQLLFEDLMTELGMIAAPVFLAPAETLGLNGFSFSLEGTIAPISNEEDFWVIPTEGKPSSVIFIPHIHVRKGLPFSTEIGAQISYIPESELFIVGAEAKWALNEGFYWIPDLAIRFSINHMIGSKDFELSTGGWDISLSKAFGIGGMLSLTPYAGYNMHFIHASSHVILDATPAMQDQVFHEMNWQDNMYHRFFFGCRLKTFIFQVALEGIIGLDSVSLFNFKLGFDY
jgi:hypothetical protein